MLILYYRVFACIIRQRLKEEIAHCFVSFDIDTLKLSKFLVTNFYNVHEFSQNLLAQDKN